MSFLEIANSRPVYVFCGIALLVVVGILIVFLSMAWKRALELGMSHGELVSVVKSTLMVSVGPLLSILVPLFALIRVLGAPWSWLRLSVIGSAVMEMMIANMALQNGGYGSLGTADLPGEAFGLMALVVGFGITAGMVLNIVFNKGVSTGLTSLRSKNPARTGLLVAALFASFLANLSASYLVAGVIEVVVFATALAASAGLNLYIKKSGRSSLAGYSFAICLVFSMAMAILWSNLLG